MSEITVEFTEKGHKYLVNGKRVPSVTTILGKTTDKSGPLTHWAANTTLQGVVTLAAKNRGRLPYPAAFAREHIESFDGEQLWAEDTANRVKFALKKQGLAFYQASSDAAARGTAIHKVMEDWAERNVVPNPVDHPEEYRGYIRACASFIVAHAPEFVASEVRLGSVQHGFAGTMDSELRLTRVCDVDGCGCRAMQGGLVRGDFKTARSVYPVPNFAQLDAYEIAAREMGRPRSDHLAVIRLGLDGSYEVVRSKAAHGCFLPFLEAYRSQRRIEESAK